MELLCRRLLAYRADMRKPAYMCIVVSRAAYTRIHVYAVGTPRRDDLYPPIVPEGLEINLTICEARTPCEPCVQPADEAGA